MLQQVVRNGYQQTGVACLLYHDTEACQCRTTHFSVSRFLEPTNDRQILGIKSLVKYAPVLTEAPTTEMRWLPDESVKHCRVILVSLQYSEHVENEATHPIVLVHLDVLVGLIAFG